MRDEGTNTRSESKLLDIIREEIQERRDGGSSWNDIASEIEMPMHRIRTFMDSDIKYPRVHDCEKAYQKLTGHELKLKR